MIYNLALVFTDDIHEQILSFAEEFQSAHYCEFKYDVHSIPHATLIKYESDDNPFEEMAGEYEVTFSGLTILPSRGSEDTGTWIEISVLISQSLRFQIENLQKQLRTENIRSEVGDLLRPHITICKLTSQSNISIRHANHQLFRRNNIPAKISIGRSISDGFEFNHV